ncbi:MAG: PAS domain-containing protein, partial [Polyangiaceae bacterium]
MGRQWSSDEERRLAILRSFDILDTPPEETFDAITRVAAHVAAAPIALVSLIDRDRQWFKSRHGLETSETARELAFCDHALGAAEPLVVEDAALDDRFSQNPLVSSDPHIRFYAGFPVNAVEGTGLGTLCVIDRKPRQLTAEQREIMLSLARHVEVQLEVRRLARNHAEANALLDAVTDHAPVMLFLKDAESLNVTLWNREAERVSGIRREEILGKTGYESFPAAEMDGFHERDRRVLDELVMVEAEETLTGPNGARVLHTRKIPLIGSEGKAKHLLGISTDITALRERDRELAKIHATLEDRVKQRTAELEAANARLTEALA